MNGDITGWLATRPLDPCFKKALSLICIEVEPMENKLVTKSVLTVKTPHAMCSSQKLPPFYEQ
jgi:hypothetical protein